MSMLVRAWASGSATVTASEEFLVTGPSSTGAQPGRPAARCQGKRSGRSHTGWAREGVQRDVGHPQAVVDTEGPRSRITRECPAWSLGHPLLRPAGVHTP